MDQNENKNLESVAEEATEVKDEVVEAAKETRFLFSFWSIVTPRFLFYFL